MKKTESGMGVGRRSALAALGLVGALVATTLVGYSLPSSVADAAPATNVELPPTRLIDTRPNVAPPGVISVPKVKLTPNVALEVAMAGAGGLPATGAAAFNLNVTATDAVGPGNLAVYPCAEGYQGTSNLNFQAATATSRSSAAVSVTAAPDAAGKVCFRSNRPVHIVVDTFGWLPAGGGYDGVGPFRLFDTRGNAAAVSVPVGRLTPLAELGVKVSGVGGVPASGVEAVLINLVATAGANPGFLAAYSCAGGYDGTSNVNFQATQSRANAAVVPVGSDGRICFLANQPVHVVVDVIGTFAEGSGFTAAGPTRMFDTRSGEGGVPVGKIRLPNVLEFDPFAAGLGLPTSGVTALSLNVVGARGVAPGFLSVYPCAQGSGGSSTLNYQTGQSVANSIFVPVDSAGKVCFASNQLVDVVVDLTGWFTEPTTEPPVPDPGEVLYRVNAGGPVVGSSDGGPAWSADVPVSSPSPYVNDGPGNQRSFTAPVGTVSAAGGVPAALFETERWDPVGGNEMVWNFPVASGKTYRVSLFMSEKFFGVVPTAVGGVGARVFDVAIEGSVVLDDLDLFAQLGPAVGGVFTFDVPMADDFLTIDLIRSVDNPAIDAIEIRSLDATLGVLSADPSSVSFDVVEGGGDAAGITVTGDGAAPVLSVSESASWLTVAASSASEFTATADAAGLAPGVYSTTITFSAAGHLSLGVPVSLTVTAVPPVGEPGEVLYRVNAGGPVVASSDGGPVWSADVPASSPSPYVNHGVGNDRSFTAPVGTVSAAGGVPAALFETERWDPVGGNEMVWNFPVTSGEVYEVSLFMSEKFFGVNPSAVGGVGARVFDVAIEGSVVLDDLDLFAQLGPAVGGVFTFDVPVVDGAVTIGFTRMVQNPTIDAIEIRRAEPAGNTLSVSRRSVSFGSVVVGESRVESVTLSNVGVAGDPVISGISAVVSGAGMSVSKVPAVSLQPGQSTTVDVTFAPGSVGVVDGSLVVSHSGVNSPVTVDLGGRGVSSVPVGFQVDGLTLAGLNNPTSLDFGPDGRLYVSQQNGLIKAYTLQRNGTADYSISNVENINLVQGIKNHNDDGSPSTVANRQVTGLMTAGTPLNPVLYVSSSDPRIAGGGTGADAGLDTNSGVISKLTRTGSTWVKVDLVRGLPRSEENHSTNGMVIDDATNTMYVMSGGFTNKGAPSNNFAGTPEYALAAALLTVDLDVIEAMSNRTDQYGQQYKYDLPTLNDPTRADKPGADPADPYADVNDPWGGNDGLNQSIIVPGGPVQVYSGGYRNAYDVVLTESGRLYTWDNGPNTGWGGTPIGNGTANCTNELNEANGGGKPDGLHHIAGKGYYAGHPNPTRGNANSGYIQYVKQGGVWVAAGTYDWSDFPVRPVPLADIDPRECNYLSPANPNQNGALATIGSSTNGMAEYTASNFGGAMKGDLLAAAFNGSIYRSVLSPDGTQLVSNTALMQGFGSTPLDVTAVGDNGPFPGTVWAVTYGSNSLVVFEPNDYAGGGAVICTGLADDNDDDGDGFTNAHEIAAGTDPCNASSVPSDFDGDFVPDVVDTNDDGDNLLDVADVFALDAANGLSTPVAASCPADFSDDTVPSCLRMSAGSRSPSILDLGFTGLMLNGEDYLDQFDPENVVPGGAAGVLAVKATSNGDATGPLNSQENGFQFGVLQPTVPFEVHTRVKSPFTSGAPVGGQAVGIQVGDGTQYNFVSLMLTANGGTGGVRLGHEIGDVFSVVAQPDVPGVVGTVDTDLFLTIDPATKLITAEYSLDGAETRVSLGSTTVPAAWVQSGTALAVGVMSTSGEASSFNANWDFIDVTIAESGPQPVSGERALIEVIPGNSNINASTFTNGSFTVTNQSENSIEIESIVFDLKPSILPDMVFDPFGTAGDVVAKGFTPNSGGAATGYVGFEYLDPHGGDSFDGYDGLRVDFGDFDPNETFKFSIDIDPTSIQGLPAPGPNDSGSVSGLELAGSTVTVTFSNGTVRTGYLFSDGSNAGATAVIADGLPVAPQLDMPGVAGSTSVAGQTLEVRGPAGATVRILHVDSGLFVAPDAVFPDPLYSNSIVSQLVSTTTLDALGNASVPVTLRNLDGTAGINHFVAVVESAGAFGATSQTLTVKYTI